MLHGGGRQGLCLGAVALPEEEEGALTVPRMERALALGATVKPEPTSGVAWQGGLNMRLPPSFKEPGFNQGLPGRSFVFGEQSPCGEDSRVLDEAPASHLQGYPSVCLGEAACLPSCWELQVHGRRRQGPSVREEGPVSLGQVFGVTGTSVLFSPARG